MSDDNIPGLCRKCRHEELGANEGPCAECCPFDPLSGEFGFEPKPKFPEQPAPALPTGVMGEWGSFITPLAAKFQIAAQFGASTTFNAVGSQAVFKLLVSMAARLDRAVRVTRTCPHGCPLLHPEPGEPGCTKGPQE